jgi:hypothetical protein
VWIVKFGMDSVAAQAVRINDRGVVTNISLRVTVFLRLWLTWFEPRIEVSPNWIKFARLEVSSLRLLPSPRFRHNFCSRGWKSRRNWMRINGT